MMSKKKTKTSIKYLPLEIWTLIFARMPGKTLLRFRCVCKPWCFIIDDPDFVYLHLQLRNMNINTKNKLCIAFDIAEKSCRKGDLMTIRRADNFWKTGHNLTSSETDNFPGTYNGLSCNGLILMWQFVDRLDTTKILRLWNPSIRKLLLIPPCPIPPRLHHKTEFVFGFVPSTKEHKILAITFDEIPGTQPIDMFFAVFTLSDQRWTVRDNGLNVERSCFRRIWSSYFYPTNTIFFQGAVHCIEHDLYGDNKYHLVSLDIDQEKFTFLEIPYFSDDKSPTKRFLFILGESLAVFSISKVYTRICVLEHHGGERVWTRCSSKFSTRDGFSLFMKYHYSRAFYYESDHGGCLIFGKNSYDIASGQVTERGKSMRRNVRLEPYSESLVLHKVHGVQEA